MSYSGGTIWAMIAVLAAGTFLIRFSFLGIIGDRSLPDWVLRLLRFTPVAIIPGLVAPLVLTPGEPLDPALVVAGVATLAVGHRTKNLLAAVAAGALAFYAVGYWSTP